MSYIGNVPINGAFQKLDSIAGSFNAVTTTFTTAVSSVAVQCGTATNLIIVLNGVVQEPVTSYSVSGSTITFSSAPTSGTTFFGVRLGNVGTITGVSAGSISLSSLDAGLAASIASISDIGLPVTVVSGTSQTAVSNIHYLMTNVAASTVTLPLTPAANDEVWITFDNGLYTNIIARPTTAEKIVNGTFAANIGSWASASTYTSTGLWSAGEMQVTATTNSGSQIQSFATEIGKKYRIQGMARLVSGTGTVGINVVTSTGSYLASATHALSTPTLLTQDYTAVSTTTYVGLSMSVNGAVGKFDDVSVKEIVTIFKEEEDFTVNAGVLLTWKFKYMNNDWKIV